jgi:DNA-directed RNA polymerase specialized sigma24 family protein
MPGGAATAVAATDVAGWNPLELLAQRAAARKEAIPSESIDWDAAMQKFGRRVVVSLIAKGALPERAKELAQDAWLRVIQNHRLGRLTEVKLPGVVIKQATFLWQDDRRRCSSRYTHESVDGTVNAHRDERELEQQAAARHKLRKVREIIARAHPNARRVFALMYDGEARSAAEIADEVGLSVQRVRQIACEFRKTLRSELQGGSDA